MSQIRLDQIVIGQRARRDHGDMDGLVESIREHGILSPITLLPGNRLLCGGRRIEAARTLGMETIPFHIAATQDDALSRLKAERDENTHRKDMTAEELVDIGEQVAVMEKANADERRAEGQRRGGVARHAGSASGSMDPEAEPKKEYRTRDAVADALGVSEPTYRRMKTVVTAARNEDEPAEVRQVAQEALAKMNAGEMAPRAATDAIHKARGPAPKPKPTPKPDQSNLTRPQPPKYGGNRKKDAAVIESIAASLSGLAMAADGIAEFDHTVTTEEAARLADDLSTSIRSLNRLKQSLTRKATS